MLNRWIGIGRITKDLDLRYSPSGKAVLSFTIACNRPFTNQQGSREADFINCVVFDKQAESLANYQQKGSLISVEGRIQSRSYDGQDGKKVYVTEVVCDGVQFLERKGERSSEPGFNNMEHKENGNTGQNNPFEAPGQKPSFNDDPFGGTSKTIDISSDDLPF